MDKDLVGEFMDEEIEDINKVLTLWGVYGLLKSFENWLKRKEIIQIKQEI